MSEYLKNKTLLVTGGNGMVGKSLVDLLSKMPQVKYLIPSREEVDFCNYSETLEYFKAQKPNVVINLAAKVGGIKANISYPADFLHQNLDISSNLVKASHCCAVEFFLNLGSSCIYPKECPQPMKESMILTGPLEPTNEGYAIAKIAMIKLLEYYGVQHGLRSVTLIPPNLYGPYEQFDLENSHVLSALVKRFSDNKEQKEIKLWGTGIAQREFMHSKDLAEAIIFFLDPKYSGEIINVGWGKDISILNLAHKISETAGYKGEILWDSSMPDGMLRKCMDVERMKSYGFSPKVDLDNGISELLKTYNAIA